jgi:hypothetical protein
VLQVPDEDVGEGVVALVGVFVGAGVVVGLVGAGVVELVGVLVGAGVVTEVGAGVMAFVGAGVVLPPDPPVIEASQHEVYGLVSPALKNQTHTNVHVDPTGTVEGTVKSS